MDFVQMASPFQSKIGIQMLAVFSPIKLTLCFRARPLGIGEKLGEFLVGPSIEALRNVVHDRTQTSVQLIKQRVISPKSIRTEFLPKQAILFPG